MVPTSQGAMPLSHIYVTDDPVAVDAVSADGRVVCLGPAALQAWVNAGARSLDKKSEINFSDRLSDPLKLRDIFPELGKIIGNKELANALARKADAVWVSGLSEITGPIEGHPTIARDATGLFLLDRERFEGLHWNDRSLAVLTMLDRHGMLLRDVPSLMARLATSRVADARARVRSEPTIEQLLLCAVGVFDLYLDFGVVVVHDIVVVVALLLVDLEEAGDLFSGQFFSLVGSGFVVHHLVELGKSLRVVLVCMARHLHFSSKA